MTNQWIDSTGHLFMSIVGLALTGVLLAGACLQVSCGDPPLQGERGVYWDNDNGGGTEQLECWNNIHPPPGGWDSWEECMEAINSENNACRACCVEHGWGGDCWTYCGWESEQANNSMCQALL